MAQIQDRKSNFYSQKRFIRDELSAPQYLESAGDVFIKNLAKKQMNKCTTLQEQLAIVQNFEKGFDLNPDNRKGVTCLEEFKKYASTQSDTSPEADRGHIQDLNELIKDKGLTRHELELNLCEKPNSAISQLYMFAIGNRQQKRTSDNLGSNHPLNQLKKIEEECFGQNKKAKSESVSQDEVVKKKVKRKKRKRKRKAQRGATEGSEMCPLKFEPQKSPNCFEEEKEQEQLQEEEEEEQQQEEQEQEQKQQQEQEQEEPKASVSRPSLWDVKDMKKWSESKQIGCKPLVLYTIKNGKIIKLEEEESQNEESVT